MENAQVQRQSDNLVKKFDAPKSSLWTSRFIAILAVLIIFGIGTGYLFANKDSKSMSASEAQKAGVSSSAKEVVGSEDLKTFSDTAVGTLKKGGIKGEGAYRLERTGGESQNVYLTSSIIDLSSYAEKKIKVWGQTQKAQYAGWLMDVGRIEVLE